MKFFLSSDWPEVIIMLAAVIIIQTIVATYGI